MSALRPSRYRLVSESGPEPVSDDDLMAFARVDDSADLLTLNLLAKSARRTVEQKSGVSLVTKDWIAEFDLPRSVASTPVLEIAKRPIISLASVAANDGTGAMVPLAPSSYSLSISEFRGRVSLVGGASWGGSAGGGGPWLQVSFKTGPSDSASVDDLLMAIRLLTKNWFDNRDLQGVVPGAVADLIAPAVDWSASI